MLSSERMVEASRISIHTIKSSIRAVISMRRSRTASAGHSTVAAMRWLAASPGTVVEVHLLPALSSADATPQELATTAEYAVAAVLEAPSPAPSRGSRRACEA